jgi:hypothetical protein
MDCLQYFTGRTGTVKSFNWRDVTGTATRQLANQDYSICFRTAPGFTVSYFSQRLFQILKNFGVENKPKYFWTN